jgi:hypothetical protein
MCHTNGFDPLCLFVCHSIEAAKTEKQPFSNTLKINLPVSTGESEAIKN